MTCTLVFTVGATASTPETLAAIASASLSVRYFAVSPVDWALRSRMTVTELVPNEAISSSITLLAPAPTANAAITAPTPMMMPSVVRNERVLLRRRARSAVRKISTNEIMNVHSF